jgi:hypothetical protein
MAEVTGPIRSLPGSAHHHLPDGAMCDDHPDVPAVARVQGETDSFGSEMWDLCKPCLDAMREQARSPEARTGKCEWCKSLANDLRDARDYDEGMNGRVYRVCGPCIRKANEEAERELYENDLGDDCYDC